MIECREIKIKSTEDENILGTFSLSRRINFASKRCDKDKAWQT